MSPELIHYMVFLGRGVADQQDQQSFCVELCSYSKFVGECVIASGCWVELGFHFQGSMRSNYEDNEL